MEIGSIAELVRGHGRTRPDAPAFCFGGEWHSWAAMDQRSSRVGRALRGQGIGPGTRVAYLGRNSLAFFELLFGASKVGATVVPVNWRLAGAELATIVVDSDASLLVVDAGSWGLASSIADQLGGTRLVIAGGFSDDDGDADVETFESMVGRSADDHDHDHDHDHDDPGFEPGPDDVALVLYTSGTTGRAKGAMLTNRNIWAMLPPTARDWGFGPASVSLVTLPNFHVGGVGWAMVGISVGASSVVLPEFEANAVLAAISEQRVTHAVFVPAVISALLATPAISQTDLGSFEYLVYGASPISESVLSAALERFGCRFVQSYGLTETTGGVIQLLPDDHDPGGPLAHRLRAAGQPMQYVEMRVVDPVSGAAREPFAVGEIQVRSPRVMLGYWNRPEETAAAVDPDGWLHTGDAGYLDDDGYLYISDRVKDMIISGGENIYPAEIENALMAHDEVADVAVIGVPSDRWGETPKALVVPVAGRAPSESALIEFCRDRLARYKCPTSVEFVADLPRNPTGKVLKHQLREPYWAGHDRQVN